MFQVIEEHRVLSESATVIDEWTTSYLNSKFKYLDQIKVVIAQSQSAYILRLANIAVQSPVATPPVGYGAGVSNEGKLNSENQIKNVSDHHSVEIQDVPI